MLRSKAIANNIANVNTPGYKRVEVTFEDELRKALDRGKLRGMQTNEKHLDLGKLDIASINPKIKKPVDPTLPSGVNNVDIDSEMAKLAENQLLFNFSAKFLKGKFSKLNAAIQAKSVQ
jgi:flagellar basal-body rod protein FlgB